MSKKTRLEFQIDMDAKNAQLLINKLQKQVKDLDSSTKNVGKGLGEGQQEASQGPSTDSQSDLINTIKDLTKSNQELMDRLADLGNTMYSQNRPSERPSAAPGQQETTSTAKPADTPSKGQAKETSSGQDLGGIIGKVASALFAGNYIKNYVSAGMQGSRIQQMEALTAYNRIGLYGSNFRGARKDAFSLGKEYGKDARQSIMAQESILSQAGFKDKESLDQDTKATMDLETAYGLSPYEATGGYGKLVRAGALRQGQGKDYANVLASSIRATDMTGRESEQARALEKITDILTDGNLHVTNEAFENLTNLHATLGNLDKSLKGDRGADLLGKAQGLFNSGDEMSLRMMGYGSDLGLGLRGYIEASRLADRGLSDPKAIDKLIENGPKFLKGGWASDMGTAYISQMTGTSIDEAEVLGKLLSEGKSGEAKAYIDKVQGKEDIESKTQDAKESAVMKAQVAEISAEEAKIGLGDEVNEALAPVKEFYSKLPGMLQGALGIGGGVLGGVGKGLGFGFGANLFKGTLGAGKFGAAGSKALGGIKTGAAAAGQAGLGTIAGSAAVVTAGAAAIGGTLGFYKDYNKSKKNQTLSADSFFNEKVASGPRGHNAGLAKRYKDDAGNYTDDFYKDYARALGLGSVEEAKKVARQNAKSYAIGITEVQEDNELAYLHKGERVLTRQEAKEYESTKSPNEDLDRLRKTNLEEESNLLRKAESILKEFFEDKDLDKKTVEERKIFNKDDEKNLFPSSEYSKGLSAYKDRQAGANYDDINLKGNDVAEQMWNWLKDRGYSDAAAGAVLGNASVESNFNTEAIGDNGTAYGLFQWRHGRQDGMRRHAANTGQDPSSVKAQLEYMDKELGQYLNYDKFVSGTDVNALTELFTRKYEIPDMSVANLSGRKAYARKAKKEWGNYAIGIDRVPEDNHKAILHKDEAVLNKFEADEWRKKDSQGQGIGQANIDINLNIDSKAQTPKDIEQIVTNAVMVAMQKAGIGSNQVNLSKSFARTPN